MLHFKHILAIDIMDTSMMTSSNGNIFRVTGHLCGEFTGSRDFPTQRPVTRSFDVSFDLRLNKRLNKQPWGWWFETLSWSLWRHCNALEKPWELSNSSLTQVMVQAITWTMQCWPSHVTSYGSTRGRLIKLRLISVDHSEKRIVCILVQNLYLIWY